MLLGVAFKKSSNKQKTTTVSLHEDPHIYSMALEVRIFLALANVATWDQILISTLVHMKKAVTTKATLELAKKLLSKANTILGAKLTRI